MQFVEYHWLSDSHSTKEALQQALHCSGQLMKKYFSSKELARPVKAKELIRLPLDFVNNLKINPVFVGPRPSIITETQQYLALHKPPGVHGHPLCYSDQDTLLNFLVEEQRWDVLRVNEDHYDRGLLYRLDYETSGVILLAKNEDYFHAIREHFKEKMKQKLYLTIVEGDFDKVGRWTHYFRATGVKGARQKVADDFHPDAQSGELKVKKLAFQEGKSLLLVGLQTGLRHQIRAQLSHLGFPILGDELYGGKKSSRLYLHAWKYEWDEMVEDDQAEGFNEFFDLAIAKADRGFF